MIRRELLARVVEAVLKHVTKTEIIQILLVKTKCFFTGLRYLLEIVKTKCFFDWFEILVRNGGNNNGEGVHGGTRCYFVF